MAIGSIFLIYHGLSNVETEQLCRRPLFLILRIGGEFIVYFFLVIGIVLTKQIRTQTRDTEYERGQQKQAQERALRKLWIVISSCVFNCTFQIVYDTIIFARGTQNLSCDITIQDSVVAQEIIWFISRSNACTLWIIPIIYIFTPGGFPRLGRLFSCCRGKRSYQNGIGDGTTLGRNTSYDTNLNLSEDDVRYN